MQSCTTSSGNEVGVQIPRSEPHGASRHLRTTARSTQHKPCAYQVIDDFAKSGHGEPEVECLSKEVWKRWTSPSSKSNNDGNPRIRAPDPVAVLPSQKTYISRTTAHTRHGRRHCCNPLPSTRIADTTNASHTLANVTPFHQPRKQADTFAFLRHARCNPRRWRQQPFPRRQETS